MAVGTSMVNFERQSVNEMVILRPWLAGKGPIMSQARALQEKLASVVLTVVVWTELSFPI